MLILGLDQSITQTGYALYEFPGDERHMRCGSFSCKGDDAGEKCDAFARHLKPLIGSKERPIDFICWERARQQISAYPKKKSVDLLGLAATGAASLTVNADQLILPEIQGIIRAGAIFYRIPYESVSPVTWRAALYGRGGGRMARDAAKARAKEYCKTLGIKWNNENEAEAACIARWAATCSQTFRLLMAGAA